MTHATSPAVLPTALPPRTTILTAIPTGAEWPESLVAITGNEQSWATFLTELRDIAVDMAAAAGAMIARRREVLCDASGVVAAATTKSSAVDPVTEVDQASENLIRQLVQQRLPESRVLGEEDGEDPIAHDGKGLTPAQHVLWVVDPIDGTVNFMYGVPAYSVSIAATIDGQPVAAAVCDIAATRLSNPTPNSETTTDLATVYRTSLGAPAELVTVQLTPPARAAAEDPAGLAAHYLTIADTAHPTTTTTKRTLVAGDSDALAQALVATGFSYLAPRRAEQARVLTELLPRVRDIRRLGSAALDLCRLAAGEMDCYYEHGLGPWDHFAGALIAAQAGAVVAIPEISVRSDDGIQVTAAKPGLIAEFSELLSQVAPGGALYPR